MKVKKEEPIDDFKERLIKQRKKMLIIAGVGIFFILLITGYYVYKLQMESKAKEFEYEAYKYYFGRIRDSGLTPEQRFIKAGQLFTEAYEKKRNLTYLLNAGYVYERAGQKEKAIEILDRVVKSNDPNLSNLAKVKIASIHLKYNETELAVKQFNEIVNGKSDILKDFAIFQLGKLNEKEKRQVALEYNKMLVEKFPDSPFSEIVKAQMK